MTSGYQNSAGTDLDNIFLANGSGTWDLGFQVAGGQDLVDEVNRLKLRVAALEGSTK